MPDFHRYWGKAGDPERAVAFHRLVHHSLDVAACGRVLLESDPVLLARITDRVEGARVRFERGTLLDALSALLALHDLGKFSGRFQSLRPDVARSLGWRGPTQRYDVRHDAMGMGLLSWGVLPTLLESGRLSVRVDGEVLGESDVRDVLSTWISAATGHHGAPPRAGEEGAEEDWFRPEQRADATAFAEAVFAMFGPVELDFVVRPARLEDALAPASWLVAGVAVLADWVGSNRDWFPYETDPLALREYWETIAIPRARRAVAEARLVPAGVRPFGGFRDLFDHLGSASPIQELAARMELGREPQLLLVEDQTGAGKTEAALVLAHRLLSAGLGDGLFFALPTMATANAMHSRLERVYSRLFAPESAPTYVLAHGEARSVLGLERGARGRDYAGVDAELGAELRDWIGDSAKKALLAQVGVGTIDQALLAALRTKHSVLRLVGLQRHVLVVDEVHACDPYVAKVLERLLEFHALLGGSAVLLSATLPAGMRSRFVAAFRRGRGISGSEEGQPAAAPYPLVTQARREGVVLHACDARRELARIVPVRFVASEEAVHEYVVSQAAAGRCVAWVRNTVRAAVAGFEALAARLGPERTRLFHAKFLLGDRLRIEREVVEGFGKASVPSVRAGRVLVATQVVEQSLDLDFDALVTDLAPIDSVVQRLGRLQRHARPGRPPPELVVLAPEWTEAPGAEWPGRVLPGTIRVYPDPGVLWRTQRVLRDRGVLAIPADARHLVESVYGSDEAPEALARGAQRAIDEDLSERSVAAGAAWQPSSGYRHDGRSAFDDVGAPTRLGEATVRVRFARESDGSVVPYLGVGAAGWAMSSVRIPASRLPGCAAAAAGAAPPSWADALPDRGRDGPVFVVPEPTPEGFQLTVKIADDAQIEIRYSLLRGLVVARLG